MRKTLFLSVIASGMLACMTPISTSTQVKDFVGIYKQKRSSIRLKFESDGTYILYNPAINFTPVIEQCEYASKGKWSIVSSDVLEITSENYLLRQKGFEYELKKENKFSQDSLYIQVNFSTDFDPVRLNLYFNNDNSKTVTTDKTYIVLPKSRHLWDRKINTNKINFSLNAVVWGVTLYKSRISFEIFEEYIDTEKYNYLTIMLPNFDRCFFAFEPYNQELIYRKRRNQLMWQGYIWEKQGLTE